MKYKIKILPSAYADMRKGKKWYSDINEDLGIDFRESVNEEIDYIKDNPEHYQTRYKEFRLSKVTRFPYAIFYIIDESRKLIVIVGVMHMSRNPEIMTNRKIKI